DTTLRDHLVAGLEAIDGVQVLRLWPDATEPVAVVSFTLPGHDAGLVAAYLSAEHGIGVRDGRFCAPPLLPARGVSAGLRAGCGTTWRTGHGPSTRWSPGGGSRPTTSGRCRRPSLCCRTCTLRPGLRQCWPQQPQVAAACRSTIRRRTQGRYRPDRRSAGPRAGAFA